MAVCCYAATATRFNYASLSITSCARNARSVFGARSWGMARVGPIRAFSQINVTAGRSAIFASAAVSGIAMGAGRMLPDASRTHSLVFSSAAIAYKKSV